MTTEQLELESRRLDLEEKRLEFDQRKAEIDAEKREESMNKFAFELLKECRVGKSYYEANDIDAFALYSNLVPDSKKHLFETQ